MWIPAVYLQDRQTTGTGKSVQAFDAAKDVVATYTGNGTTSGGTIILEESDDPQYTGTWSQIESVSASTVTGNAKSAHHVRVGAGLWCRARISSDITGGGTITVTLSGK